MGHMARLVCTVIVDYLQARLTHTGKVDGTATAGLPLRLLLGLLMGLLLGLLLLRLRHQSNSDSSLLDRHGGVA